MCVNGFRIKFASKFAFGSRNITHDDEDGLIHTVESTDRKTIDTGIKDVFPVEKWDTYIRCVKPKLKDQCVTIADT